MPHNSRPNKTRMATVRRYTNLRNAGVPSIITGHAAWYLSGGIVGRDGDHEARVSLASIAKRVPDCEHFLPDYQEVTG